MPICWRAQIVLSNRGQQSDCEAYLWAEKSGGGGEGLGTKAKCHRKCARTKEEVWRTKVGQRKEVKPQNNLDFSIVQDFGFHCTAVVFLGCLKVLFGLVNT